MLTSPPALTTSYACPWALIEWGGTVKGQRPRARFGFIEKACALDGVLIGYRAYTMSGNGKWTKRTAFYPTGCVLHTWRTRPSAEAIQRAKKSLPIQP